MPPLRRFTDILRGKSNRAASVAVTAVALGALAAVPGHAQNLVAGLQSSLVLTGLPSPTSMAFAPDGRLFVLEQGGTIKILDHGGVPDTPFAQFNVDSNGERGLLGIAFDPNFATNNYIYLYKTEPGTAGDPNSYNEVVRVTANGNVMVPGSETQLLRLPDLGPTNHNGGSLQFLPDGTLLVGVGENGTPSNSPSLDTLFGKVLRINTDGSIPTNNPFYGTASGQNRAIWAYGLRNPFTMAVQPGTGVVYINDVGQDTYEEIDKGIAGANYGWPSTEGPTNAPGITPPLYSYTHGFATPFNGDAITGGTFYDPTTIGLSSDYVGKYFFSDFTANWIDMYDPITGAVTNIGTDLSSPVDLAVSPVDGALYSLSVLGGSVTRISGTGAVAPEPASVAFLAVSLGGSLFLRRRRKSIRK